MSDIKPKSDGGFFGKMMDGLESLVGGAETMFNPPDNGAWSMSEVGDAHGIEATVWEVRNPNGRKITCYDSDTAERIVKLLNG